MRTNHQNKVNINDENVVELANISTDEDNEFLPIENSTKRKD